MPDTRCDRMASRSLVALALIGCGGAPPALPTNHANTAAASDDPIACSEASLRALAAHFPQAALEIQIVDGKQPDSRGVIELPCRPAENDAACLARGRRAIPPGFVELVFDNGAGYIDGAYAWELTLAVDGRVEVVRSEHTDPLVVEARYRAKGHRVQHISQRAIATPQNRQAVVWYGHQRPHRTANLWFGPDVDDADEVLSDRVFALEKKLQLTNDGFVRTTRGDDPALRWVARTTCR